MIIKTEQQLTKYKKVCNLSTQILKELYDATKIGVTPLEIDKLARKLCQQHQTTPGFLGVGPSNNPYKYATCIAVNDTVVHGIPNNTPFKAGDIIKVDFGLIKDGLQTDHCFCVGLEPVDEKDLRLITVARQAIQTAAKMAVVGKRTGDLGHKMQTIVEEAGFNVAKEFIGHGIGESMHEAPQLPAYGQPGMGEVLQEGMVLCVEAQVLAGSDEVEFLDDGWTVKTADGSKAAMFEYMVVVGKKQPEILTKTMGWEVVK